MTVEERREFLKILSAHAETIAVAEACAATTRDLAAEVARGGMPPREALVQTIGEAERVLTDLVNVRREVERLILVLS